MTPLEFKLTQELAQATKSLESALERCRHSEELCTGLMSQLQLMKRHRFGQRSERFIDPDDPQMAFDAGGQPIESDSDEESGNEESDDNEEDPTSAISPQSPDSNVIDIQSAKPRKTKTSVFPDHFRRVETTIPVDEQDELCTCRCQKVVINHTLHERLNYVPAVFEVLVERREVVVCPKGCSGEMVTANKPQHILPKAKITESLLAHLIVSKLDDRQPDYHLSKQLESRFGVGLSRQTIARNKIKCSLPLQPLINLMKDEVIDYDVSSLDATGLQVLKEHDRPATRTSYAYCFRGGPPGKEVSSMSTIPYGIRPSSMIGSLASVEPCIVMVIRSLTWCSNART